MLDATLANSMPFASTPFITSVLHSPSPSVPIVIGFFAPSQEQEAGLHQGNGSEAADAGDNLCSPQEEGQQQPGALQRVCMQLRCRPHGQQRHALQPENLYICN